MHNAKKYIITGVTLGSIAAVAAGLIAVTNLVTAKKIKQNELDAVNSGIASIFGNGASVSAEADLTNYQYVVHYYSVANSSNEFMGYALRTSGSNMYGKISLIAGFDVATHNFMSLYLVSNEQTYASTLVDNYVTPLNSGDRDLEDVSCGATYGAKLIRDMVNEAKVAADALWSK